ncbi:hypothetical protein H6P81_019258 [Aristolochia fimbriata]|uniref:Wall-associated receptor kinase galacturonan-binding domain-containing protein n=1 Tax=Aristolochia fimbriata TaxID=158543 RepID=A0AAV7DS26_ARIFI|nr:hypothetical protein H6P81_019258 [Aristolochia fimbriata]
MAAGSLLFFLLTITTALGSAHREYCRDRCGSIPIKYPLGSGLGCGHPELSPYIRCTDDDGGALQVDTRSGVYAVTAVDYPSSTLTLADPLMSTCAAMRDSGGFSLDPAAPFRLLPRDRFLLLGCSTSSPVFDPDVPLCDAPSASRHLCRGLYSCRGAPGDPDSTCCLYVDGSTTVDDGFSLDLPKLQCASYTSVLGFGDREGDPMKWDYGIALTFNRDSYATDACDACEASDGTCGFDPANRDSFLCACRNGINTTASCYGQGYAWSGSWTPGRQNRKMACVLGIIILWIVLLGS